MLCVFGRFNRFVLRLDDVAVLVIFDHIRRHNLHRRDCGLIFHIYRLRNLDCNRRMRHRTMLNNRLAGFVNLLILCEIMVIERGADKKPVILVFVRNNRRIADIHILYHRAGDCFKQRCIQISMRKPPPSYSKYSASGSCFSSFTVRIGVWVAQIGNAISAVCTK